MGKKDFAYEFMFVNELNKCAKNRFLRIFLVGLSIYDKYRT